MADEISESNWKRRVGWAKCVEPFKTEIDTLASHWVEGSLTDSELAIEILGIQSDVQFATECNEIQELARSQVLSELNILTQSLLITVKQEKMPSSSEREETLELIRAHLGKLNSNGGPSR